MNEGANFLQNYSYNEVNNSVENSYINDDYTNMFNIIEEACEDLDKRDKHFRLLQQQRIEALELYTQNVTTATVKTAPVDSIFYSYKLLF
jgi:hypothetical protein